MLYLLKQEGIMVGRKLVGTLMRKMGIEALYRKPNLNRNVWLTRYGRTS